MNREEEIRRLFAAIVRRDMSGWRLEPCDGKAVFSLGVLPGVSVRMVLRRDDAFFGAEYEVRAERGFTLDASGLTRVDLDGGRIRFSGSDTEVWIDLDGLNHERLMREAISAPPAPLLVPGGDGPAVCHDGTVLPFEEYSGGQGWDMEELRSAMDGILGHVVDRPCIPEDVLRPGHGLTITDHRSFTAEYHEDGLGFRVQGLPRVWRDRFAVRDGQTTVSVPIPRCMFELCEVRNTGHPFITTDYLEHHSYPTMAFTEEQRRELRAFADASPARGGLDSRRLYAVESNFMNFEVD